MCGFDSHLPHQQYAPLAQLAEHLFCNQDVTGSRPVGGTKIRIVNQPGVGTASKADRTFGSGDQDLRYPPTRKSRGLHCNNASLNACLLPRRQVVRHLTLIQAFAGSTPAEASNYKCNCTGTCEPSRAGDRLESGSDLSRSGDRDPRRPPIDMCRLTSTAQRPCTGSSVAERQTLNLRVEGSIPSRYTKLSPKLT